MASRHAKPQALSPTAPSPADRRDPLGGRLGLSVPHEWWPSAALLKSFEAAGFGWVQLDSPPASVLTDPRQARLHGEATAAALATTGLQAVLHAPATLRLGTAEGDVAFEGLALYAAEVGVAQVIYHALALPESATSAGRFAAEARSLAGFAPLAERLGLTIALENLGPLYPGPETLSAHPLTMRSLARRIGSPAIALCLDLGHAHLTADLRHTWVDALCEPALEQVSVFHLHDNFGARWQATEDELGVDPVRLDLHLPPGRGTLPWERVRAMIAGHQAPIILEVHPPHRPPADELAAQTAELLLGTGPVAAAAGWGAPG